MTTKKDDYRPCSDLDIRSAGLRLAHEILHEMDEKGIPTVGKFGEVVREQKNKLKTFGEYMAKKGTNPVMNWEEYKKALRDFTAK